VKNSPKVRPSPFKSKLTHHLYVAKVAQNVATYSNKKKLLKVTNRPFAQSGHPAKERTEKLADKFVVKESSQSEHIFASLSMLGFEPKVHKTTAESDDRQTYVLK
jgi:hypothetical protein